VTERKRAILEFAYAHEDADEWTTLSVTSREMLAVERAVKGFTANTFFANVSVGGLYRIAHVVLKVRGDLDRAVTFDEFVETHDVKFGADQAATASDEGDQDDDTGSEADPTPPAA
jgi:hypothetical protein